MMSAAQTTQLESPYRMTIVEQLPDVALVHHLDHQGTAWATRGRTILRHSAGDWQPLARFPFSSPKDYFGWNRLLTRAARADKCNLFVNSTGKVLAIRANAVYRLEEDGRLVELFQIQGDCALHGGICEDPQGWTYVGEYFLNPQRTRVRIYRIAPDMQSHEVAHEFPPGSIRHVHGVFRDPYDDEALWTTVGDYTDECYLLRTRDRFQSVEQFGDGTQIYRAVTLFFTPDHVCWLTDSHLDQNYACRMDRRSAELEKGERIPCSTWYGRTTTDALHVAFTTVEKGPAIQRMESSVLVSDDGFHWTEVAHFRKDAWHPWRVFKFGVINCPSGCISSKDFYLSGEALVGLDGRSLRVRFEREDHPS